MINSFFFFMSALLPLESVISPQPEPCTIALEGMPGAGKTTLSRSLLPLLEGKGMILPELNPIPPALAEQEGGATGDAFYYEEWNARLKLLEKHYKKLGIVVLDRSHLTTLAYLYATGCCFDSMEEYESYRDFCMPLFTQQPFTLLLVLDCSPEVSLKRRNSRKTPPQFPWNSLAFLEHFQQFYQKELPKLYSGKILHIDTETITPEQIFQEMKTALHLEDSLRSPSVTPEEAHILLTFAEQHQLDGQGTAEPMTLFGCPTLYLGKYALQLEKEKVHFLTTKRIDFFLGQQSAVELIP